MTRHDTHQPLASGWKIAVMHVNKQATLNEYKISHYPADLDSSRDGHANMSLQCQQHAQVSFEGIAASGRH